MAKCNKCGITWHDGGVCCADDCDKRLKMATYKQMQEELLERMTAAGYYRYAARAECFMDVIRAFKIIDDYNEDKEGHHIIRIISPIIKGSCMGDTDFDFYTNEAPHTLQTLWDTQGTDLHRIIQTIKRFDEYDGKTDLSFWKRK